MRKSIEILLCYRGRFAEYVRELLQQLRSMGIHVTYDSQILAEKTDMAPTGVVEWFTMTDSTAPAPQQDVTWRAPLKEAIECAELVVFAIEIRDISENVLNEIRWAIIEDVHTFFLVHGAPTSTAGEAGGIVAGMLAGIYMATRGRPDYPAFGLHTFEDLEGEARRADVVVAANRIAGHLTRAREGPLQQLSGDNNVTVSDIEQRPYMRARRHLQQIQQKWHRLLAPDPPQTPVFDEAIHNVRAREQAQSQRSRTDRQIACFRRAEEILLRMQPGAFESSDYISALVVQAAVVEEMILDDIRKERPTLDFRPNILIGTVLFSNLREPVVLVDAADYAIILTDRQFIDFLYQLIKVSMLSFRAAVSTYEERKVVELDFDSAPEMIRTNPELSDGFYACVRRYVAEGRPDASSVDAPLHIHQPLGAYVRTAERHLLARAYARIGANTGAWPLPVTAASLPVDSDSADSQSALFDLAALDYSVRGRRFIDAADPLDALAGSCFLCVAEYLRNAMRAVVASDGREKAGLEDAALQRRLQNLTEHFERRMIEGGAPAALAAEHVAKAKRVGTTPLLLWAQVLPRLRTEVRAGLKQAGVWS